MKNKEMSWITIIMIFIGWYLLSDIINEFISSIGFAGVIGLAILYQIQSLRSKLLPKEDEEEEEIEHQYIEIPKENTVEEKNWFRKNFEGLDV